MNAPESLPDVARCDYEGSQYQQEFWTPERRYEDLAERAALRTLLPRTGRRIVEIGAGAGRLGDLYLGYEEIYLLDYAHSQMEQARVRWGRDPRFTFVQGDIYNLPFPDGYFDTVVTVRVLHHVKDLALAFKSIARICHPQGVYVTEYANKRNLKAIARYLLGRGKEGENPFTPTPYEFVELNIDFHPDFLAGKLRQAGFTVTEELGASFFRLPLLKSRVAPQTLARLDSLLQKPLAALRLTPSIFLKTQPTKSPAPDESARWRCPNCHSTRVDAQSEQLVCEHCRTVYPVVAGVICLRPDALPDT